MVGQAPEQQSGLAASVGLSESEFRFAISFFLYVVVSLLWKYVPTSQGTVCHLNGIFVGCGLAGAPILLQKCSGLRCRPSRVRDCYWLCTHILPLRRWVLPCSCP